MNFNQATWTAILFSVFFLLASQSKTQDKTEILILGTPHLNQVEGFKKEFLDKTLSILKEYEFDAVGIEGMPIQLLNDIASRNDSAYTDLLNYYGKSRLDIQYEFQGKLNIDLVKSQQEIDELLDRESISTEDRIQLIKLYLASGDFASAVLQYSYLEEQVEVDDVLKSDIFKRMERLLNADNEIYSLALPLSKDLGLERLEYIDNLQDESILYSEFPEFITDYVKNAELFENVPNLPIFKKVDSLTITCIEQGDLLPLYRYLNSDEFMELDYQAQWEIWLKSNFESKSDLSRYNLWEMRNLQISAYIAKTAAYYPGQRILILIGASHKSFIEKFLKQIPSIQLLEL